MKHNQMSTSTQVWSRTLLAVYQTIETPRYGLDTAYSVLDHNREMLRGEMSDSAADRITELGGDADALRTALRQVPPHK